MNICSPNFYGETLLYPQKAAKTHFFSSKTHILDLLYDGPEDFQANSREIYQGISPSQKFFANLSSKNGENLAFPFEKTLQFHDECEKKLKNSLNFAEISKKTPKKTSCKYLIQIENEEEFQVSKRIIGSRGYNMKKIIEMALNEYQFEKNCKFNDPKLIKLRLRGKGSGFKEGSKKQGIFLSFFKNIKFLQ